MDLDSYLKRGEELAQSLDLNELTDAGMEKLEDIALQMAHGAWNRSVVNPLAGVDRAHFWEIPMENCAVSILDCKNGRLELEERSRVFS